MSSIDRLTQRSTRWRFLAFLSFRFNNWNRSPVSLVTILAVAGCAAMATGLEIASRSVRTEFERSAEAIVGDADLEVTSSNLSVPEGLIDQIAAVPGVLVASPIILETFRHTGGPLDGRAIQVFGFDFLAPEKLRDYQVTKSGVKIRDPLLLLGNQNSIIGTQKLADGLGIKEGDSFNVRLRGVEHSVVLEGLLAESNLANAYGGQIVLMDVWTLQMMVKEVGWLSKVEIALDGTVALESVKREVEALVGDRAVVQKAASRASRFDAIFQLLDFAAWAIMIFTLIVASLLGFAALSLMVDSRVEQFAIMQCIGLGAREVWVLIALDAFILSGIGVVLGVILGTWMGPVIVASFSTLSSQLQNFEIAESAISDRTIWTGISVWALISTASFLLPARRTARKHPLDALDRVPILRQSRFRLRVFAGLSVLGALFVAANWFVNGVSAIGIIGLLVVGLGSTFLLVAAWMPGIVRWFRGVSVFPIRLRYIAGSWILDNSRSAALSIASVAATMAVLTTILVGVYSVVISMDEWMAHLTQGAITVRTGTPVGSLYGDPMTHETVERIRSVPGVDDSVVFYSEEVLYKGESILAIGIDVATFRKRIGFFEDEGPEESYVERLAVGDIAASKAFRSHFDVDIGDTIYLNTKRGRSEFLISGYVRDYDGPSGALQMDLSTYDHHFSRPGADFLYVWSSLPEADLIKHISSADYDQPLFFRQNMELRKAVSRILDRFENLLHSLVAICAMFSAIALCTFLLSGVLSKKSVVALMRIDGAVSGDIVLGVLTDSLVVTSVGGSVGFVIGLASGMASVQYMRQQFGWEIGFSLPVFQIGAAMLILLLICFLAALLPTRIATRVLPTSVLAG